MIKIIELINRIAEQFPFKNQPLPLEFVRVTEKFDVVQKLPYKGWVLRPE
jgi:hypothetical protein